MNWIWGKKAEDIPLPAERKTDPRLKEGKSPIETLKRSYDTWKEFKKLPAQGDTDALEGLRRLAAGSKKR